FWEVYLNYHEKFLLLRAVIVRLLSFCKIWKQSQRMLTQMLPVPRFSSRDTVFLLQPTISVITCMDFLLHEGWQSSP
ncbi:hypothetical protein, partial [Heyndrickxia coagulans]|uniref:hypothetical protein n=1 Tax=Heyndrickxia coagulans TaxID=1398 RepID=UPI001F18EC4E